VDGFRLDVANAYLHDATLADNPAVPLSERIPWHWSHEPNLQYHFNDSNLSENVEILDTIRRRVGRFPDRFVMGEFFEQPERCGGFLPPDVGLHSGYTSPLLIADDLGPDFIRKHYAMLTAYPGHWPSIAFSNHDVVRAPTRFGGRRAPVELARLLVAILLTLKGTALLYQGEELGLPEAELRRDQLRDPVGDLYYPLNKGRDGCRTPMPWDARLPHLGFTTGTPWLPLPESHRDLAVSKQELEPESTLNWTRYLLALRRAQPALCWGEIEFVDATPPVLAFRRKFEIDGVLCVFNMGDGDAVFSDPGVAADAKLFGSPPVAVTGTSLVLPGYGVAIFGL
jgi:alpha-glucosidase